ncbi:unnamed protein product [Linum tenue]|uniref:HMA domain-containing protein n=1 Tax=Linum tenue TaxID=586396 RepID=A0AAV0HFP5_9ROSI|nr:unnamed protein product [Linum tenue]
MVFSMTSWAKKEISKLVGTPRLLITQPPQPQPQGEIVEVVVAADLRCSKCRDRVADAISTMDFVAMESVEVDVGRKEVTLLAHHSVLSRRN